MGKNLLMALLPLLAVSIAFSLFVPAAQALAVGSFTMCRDIDTETSKPLGGTTAFMTTDIAAVLWVNLTDIHGSHDLRWEWYSPAMVLYASVSQTLEVPSGYARLWYVVSDRISIEGYPPTQNPGTWCVKFYVDNTLMLSTSFEIVRWTDVADIKAKYDKLKSDYETVLAQFSLLFDTLRTEVEKLKSGYNTLTTEFEKLGSDYNKLKDDYISLSSEYESAIHQLSTTSAMMYVFIITTIVFIATTAYFGIRKLKAKPEAVPEAKP